MLIPEQFHHTGGGVARSDTTLQIPEGISRSQSSRWQRVASLSDEEFEAYIEHQIGRDEEITTAGAVKLAKRSQAQTADPGTPETLSLSASSSRLRRQGARARKHAETTEQYPVLQRSRARGTRSWRN